MFGGPGEWDHAQKAAMQCPKAGCNGEEAAFFQVQIRSADEPMTGFYNVSFADWQFVVEEMEMANLLTVYDLWT